MSKKIMVLGGTGNISVPIVHLLLQQGYDVYCFNRGQRGVALPTEVTTLTGDRTDREAFEKTMQAYTFDAVIDMIGFSAEDARSALRAFPSVGHYIFCSTVCVVGVQADYLPMDESHTLRPITDYSRGKAAAESVLLEAHYKNGYPVTIIRPSTTYGRQPSLIRQISWDTTWVDRVRKGKPVVICGEAMALHQFLHTDDAALGFVGAIGRERCFGQVYNLAGDGCITWRQFHQAAAKVLGQPAQLVSVPYQVLKQYDIPGFDIYDEIFAHHSYHSNAKMRRDIPLFHPVVSLEEGLAKTFAFMDAEGTVPNSDDVRWEDDVIARVRAL